MLNRKGIVVSMFAKLMLLYFTLAVIPIDFYHHHSLVVSARVKNFSYTSHQHPERTASLSSYCLICNIHFDKRYHLTQLHIELPVVVKLVFGMFGTLRFFLQTSIRDTTSRGPPIAL